MIRATKILPIGPVTISEEEGAIVALELSGERETEISSPLLKRAFAQLEEYFAGARQAFDLPLSPLGTPFQRAVWNALLDIPYGQTRSYKDIALAVGRPKGFRAVGMANNRNPISIFIPCHRVIGANGALVGYGGGLDKKQFLLNLERKYAAK
ncbi:MAG TPA: methylated-DNA--[protein]-cysteine S-methyltransferase [Papillibacter sp.]|jgi:methylated-DNA-[protein]-cysteine S-methyltransferase|nr:methylated-DNA--[protein]-cysteine S-methyltransferase [Papillibacter sp.]